MAAMSDESRDQQWYRSRPPTPSESSGVTRRSARSYHDERYVRSPRSREDWYGDGRDYQSEARPYRRTYPIPPGRSLAATLGHTILGTLFPGLGLMVAGRLRTGAVVLFTYLALLGTGLWFALFRRGDLLRAAVDPDTLAVLGAFLFVLGLCWVTVIVATHRSLRSRRATPLDRIIGSL